jgi:hypothetical protein
VIKINVLGADPAPHQKLPGLGPDTTSGCASGKTVVKFDGVRFFNAIGYPKSPWV